MEDRLTAFEFGTEHLGEPLLTMAEAAEYLGFTEKSLRWRATNYRCRRPVPSVLIVLPGQRRRRRYFYQADLDQWRADRVAETNWPPTPDDVSRALSSSQSRLPVPNADDFPDDGSEIPGYVGLTGRTIRPAWLSCMCCGERFLSPDRSHVRFRPECRYKLANGDA